MPRPNKQSPAVYFATELARPDVITQRELQALLDLEYVADNLAISIGLRIDAGAVIEPGALVATVSADIQTYAGKINKDDPTATCDRFGLEIYPLEHFSERAEPQERTDKGVKPCQN